MTHVKRLLMIGAVAAIATTAAFPDRASAGVLAPGKPSELVTLEPGALGSCPDGSGFAMNLRVNSDGTSSAFSIPLGYVLVITGMDWSRCVPANPSLLLSLVPYHTSGVGSPSNFAFLFSVAGPNGCAGGNVELSGVAVKSGRTVCVPSDAGSSQHRVHGYLTRDR